MSTVLTGHIQPISVSEPELDLARTSSVALSERFTGSTHPVTLRFTDPGSGNEVEATVPGAAMQVLTEALAQMAAGHPVTLVPLQAELSTQQAADLAGVSRPYLVKLLEAGQIPFRRVGEQRRVRYQDLLRYLEEHQRQASEAVSQMTAEAQELGLYE